MPLDGELDGALVLGGVRQELAGAPVEQSVPDIENAIGRPSRDARSLGSEPREHLVVVALAKSVSEQRAQPRLRVDLPVGEVDAFAVSVQPVVFAKCEMRLGLQEQADAARDEAALSEEGTARFGRGGTVTTPTSRRLLGRRRLLA